MQTYDVIVIQASTDEVHDEFDRQGEIERYIYGRGFYLGSKHSENEGAPRRSGREYLDFYFLVESRYTNMIIPRLASGLLYGHVATAEERYKVGL